MATVPVMITGVLWDHATKSGRAATMMGEASIVGLEIGGGPIYPPQQPPGGGGGQPGHPAFPIWGPPGVNFPDRPGYPPVAGHPLPEPPQQPPEGPADDDGFLKPPPESGGWAFHQEYGWLYKPSGAGPKK